MNSRSTQFRHLAAFTLAEMLVVIGVIVLLIAIAVPAFSFLTGSKSVEGATNVISASLTQARADAIGVQRTRGVVCYREQSSGRIAVALIEPKTPSNWVAGTSYSISDYTFFGSKYYVCTDVHIAATSNQPATAGAPWRELPGTQLAAELPVYDLVPNRDRVVLNVGIDCRGAGNPVGVQNYFRPAVILFNGSGSLVVSDFYLLYEGTLGRQISTFDDAGMDPDVAGEAPPPVSPPDPKYYMNSSQIALMLFDDDEGKNQMASLTPAQADQWISNNATPLLINRYNGTIVKGE